MLKYCLKKWNNHKEELEQALRRDIELNNCEYSYLVKLVVQYILNGDGEDWDSDHITVVDNGDYQGTQLFIIPANCYQPSEYEYLMTCVGYGSCSGCDTLLAIQAFGEKQPSEDQVKAFMTLCKDIVTNMIKPYNGGWRFTEDFEEVSNTDKLHLMANERTVQEMRERLIELIREAFNANGGETTVDKAADHLLANGVIVPPCKVGDTVWFNTYEKNETVCVGVKPHKVISYRLGMVVEKTRGTPTTVLPEYEFGRSVFLTREEAEQALKGGAE